MSNPTRTLLALIALAATSVAAPAASAQTVGTRVTSIASPPANTGVSANGPSDNATFSQDNRVASLLAFDSAATNLVAGDTNGRRDVFLVRRGAGDGNLAGSVERVSIGAGGVQSNGDSTLPSIDGETNVAPRCVAFQSTATNLASGDTTPDSDVFLRDLRSNTTRLVSVGKTGATNGVVDGSCEIVTFQAGGAVFAADLARGGRIARIGNGVNPDQQTNGRGVAFERGGQVIYQAFQKVNVRECRRVRGRRRCSRVRRVREVGREIVASATAAGVAGNGVSRNPSLDDSGFYVAFESTATNLCPAGTCAGIEGDRNGPVSDVFRRTLPRTTQGSNAPTPDFMQMVSFSFAVGDQGNGHSNNPAITGAGENIVFDSEATNLRENATIGVADPNGPIRDIYYWNFPRRRGQGNVSRESRPGSAAEGGGAFNGPSFRPAASNRSNYIGFTSSQSGASGETNGPAIDDVFIRFLGSGPTG